MEKRLQDFITNVSGIVNSRNLEAGAPKTLKVQNPNTGLEHLVFCSVGEPASTVVIPIGVIWVNFDPTSPDYKTAFRLDSVTPTAPYNRTWTPMSTYDSLFTVNQTYENSIDSDVSVFQVGSADGTGHQHIGTLSKSKAYSLVSKAVASQTIQSTTTEDHYHDLTISFDFVNGIFQVTAVSEAQSNTQPLHTHPSRLINGGTGVLVGTIPTDQLTGAVSDSLKSYTDTTVATEAAARDAAIVAEVQNRTAYVDAQILSEQTSRASAIAAEAAARSADITNRLNIEVQARNNAISAEATTRNTQITTEASNRAQAILDESNSRANALAIEAGARAADLANEAKARQDAINAGLAAEAQLRDAAILVETNNRTTAVSALASQVTTLTTNLNGNIAAVQAEAKARSDADTAAASRIDALVTLSGDNQAAINDEVTARTNAVSAVTTSLNALTTTVNDPTTGLAAAHTAIATETQSRSDADTALSSRIDTVTATAGSNTTAINNEITARADGDTALGSRIDTLTTTVNNNAAAIASESTARASAISAEANQRQALQVQVTGGYTGTDLTQLTSGLLYQESTTRANETSSLAQQISLLTAGVGGGFDSGQTWYFDSSVEGWTAVGGTVANQSGNVRITSSGTNPQLISPALTILGAQYSVVKARITRVAGTSAITGSVFYSTAGHTFDPAYYKNVAITLAVGESTIAEWDMSSLDAGGTDWTTNTITGIRLDLGTAADDVFDIDWIAVGRNAPSASVASVTNEAAARANAISSEATQRQQLSAKLLGTTDPSGINSVSDVTSGLVYEEQNLRLSGDTALGTRIDNLTTTVNGNTSAITTEQTTRANADSALGTRIDSLTTTVNGNTSAITTEQTARANADTALSSRIDNLTTTVNNNTSSITTEQTTRASADSALSSRIDTIVAENNSVFFGSPLTWTFKSSPDGWTATNATVTANSGVMSVASTTTTPVIRSPSGLALNGTNYHVVRLRIRRTSGSGWLGNLYYTTSGHGESSSYYKHIPDPGLPIGGGFVNVDFDMSALTAGGTDWTNNTAITQLRLDLGNSATDTFEFDWISVGKYNTTAASVTEESVTRAGYNNAFSASLSTLTSQVGQNTTAITEQKSTTDGLAAQYGVKIETYANGQQYVSGFGLLSTPIDGVPTSSFNIIADRFSLVKPTLNNGNPVTPFTIDTTTTPPTITFDALIRINNQHISPNSVGTSQLLNDSVTVDKFAGTIQSANYAQGNAGWRIKKDGSAEFNGIVISRPNLIASGVYANPDTSYTALYSTDAQGGQYPFPEGTITELPTVYIDTGYTNTSDIYYSTGPGFIARVICTGTSFTGPAYNNIYDVVCNPTVMFLLPMYNYGSGGTALGRIIIKVRVFIKSNSTTAGSLFTGRADSLTWSLLKVT